MKIVLTAGGTKRQRNFRSHFHSTGTLYIYVLGFFPTPCSRHPPSIALMTPPLTPPLPILMMTATAYEVDHDQLTALKYMIDSDRGPYADFAVYGKYGPRRARAMAFNFAICFQVEVPLLLRSVEANRSIGMHDVSE